MNNMSYSVSPRNLKKLKTDYSPSKIKQKGSLSPFFNQKKVATIGTKTSIFHEFLKIHRAGTDSAISFLTSGITNNKEMDYDKVIQSFLIEKHMALQSLDYLDEENGLEESPKKRPTKRKTKFFSDEARMTFPIPKIN